MGRLTMFGHHLVLVLLGAGGEEVVLHLLGGEAVEELEAEEEEVDRLTGAVAVVPVCPHGTRHVRERSFAEARVVYLGL